MIVLTTDRLVLRRFEPDDLPVLAALYADPDVRRYFPEGTLSIEQTREELEWFLHGHPKDPSLGLWATVERASGRMIGRCGLLPWELEGRQEVEVAYLLGKAWWGRGFATEACRSIVHHAFGALRLRRLICLVDPDNHASQRVARRIGMSLERELEGVNGDGIPTMVFAMAAETAPGHALRCT